MLVLLNLKAFNIRKTCNRFTEHDFSDFVDFENESWMLDRENICWHPNC